MYCTEILDKRLGPTFLHGSLTGVRLRTGKEFDERALSAKSTMHAMVLNSAVGRLSILSGIRFARTLNFLAHEIFESLWRHTCTVK